MLGWLHHATASHNSVQWHLRQLRPGCRTRQMLLLQFRLTQADLVCARQPSHATASHQCCFPTTFCQHPVYFLLQRIAFFASFHGKCMLLCMVPFCSILADPMCCLGGSRRCLTKRTNCRKLCCRFSWLAGCAGKLLWVLSCIGSALSIYACIQHTCSGACC